MAMMFIPQAFTMGGRARIRHGKYKDAIGLVYAYNAMTGLYIVDIGNSTLVSGLTKDDLEPVTEKYTPERNSPERPAFDYDYAFRVSFAEGRDLFTIRPQIVYENKAGSDFGTLASGDTLRVPLGSLPLEWEVKFTLKKKA